MAAAVWTTIVAVIVFIASVTLGVSVLKSLAIAWCVAFFGYMFVIVGGFVYFYAIRDKHRPHKDMIHPTYRRRSAAMWWPNEDWSRAVGRERETRGREK